jgi:hypothetical protein
VLAFFILRPIPTGGGIASLATMHGRIPLQHAMQLAMQSAYAGERGCNLSPRRHSFAATGEGEGRGERTSSSGEDAVGGRVVGDPCRRRFAGGERTAVGERRGREPTSVGRGGGRTGGRPRA